MAFLQPPHSNSHSLYHCGVQSKLGAASANVKKQVKKASDSVAAAAKSVTGKGGKTTGKVTGTKRSAAPPAAAPSAPAGGEVAIIASQCCLLLAMCVHCLGLQLLLAACTALCILMQQLVSLSLRLHAGRVSKRSRKATETFEP